VLDSPEKGAPPGRDASYEVLARRARPQTFAEVVGQEHVTRTLVNAIRSGRVAHAFVFSGMRGTGKTTTARILAKALNCIQGPTDEPCNVCQSCIEIGDGRSLDVLEVDAASQTGIDATRELLETVKYQPASARYRVYIIDEAHGLSKQAVDAFLKTLEEPPPHVKFILATTVPQKLPATILSRCQRFDFRAVSGDTLVETLGRMVQAEGMEADEDALAAIVRESGGSVRDATSLLDQVLAFSEGKVDRAAVGLALGLPDVAAVRELLEAVAAREPGRALEVVGRVVGQGSDLVRFSHEVLQRLRNLTVLAVAGAPALADLTKHEIEALERSREGIAVEDLQRWFRILLAGHEEVARSTHPRMVLEMAVIRMASLVPLSPLDQLVARLEALEQGGEGAGPGPRERPGQRGPMPRTTPPPARSGAPEPRGPRASEAAASIAPRPMPRPVPENGHGSATGPAPAPSSSAAAPLGTSSPALGDAPARPTTPGPSAPAADSAEQKRWTGLVAALQREKASRFFRLAYSRVLAIGDGVIRIAVTGREAIAALGEPETRAMIEKAIEREYGQSLRFEAVGPDAAGAAPLRADPMSLERQGREDPLVRMSVEILDGKVEGVVARTRREGSS